MHGGTGRFSNQSDPTTDWFGNSFGTSQRFTQFHRPRTRHNRCGPPIRALSIPLWKAPIGPLFQRAHFTVLEFSVRMNRSPNGWPHPCIPVKPLIHSPSYP